MSRLALTICLTAVVPVSASAGPNLGEKVLRVMVFDPTSMKEAWDQLIDLAREVGGEVWPVLVKQMAVQRTVALFGAAFLVFVGTAGVFVARPAKIEDEEGRFFATAGLILIVALGFLVFFLNIGGFIYPEGEALKSLLP